MKTLELGSREFTKVVAMDDLEFGANHNYKIWPVKQEQPTLFFADIRFQKGPIKECGVNGCHNEDLLVIVLDRLNSFQNTEYKCRENALAITKIEEALHWLKHRTDGRKTRGVEGTHTV